MRQKGDSDARRLLAESPPPRLDVARGYAVSGEAEELLRRFEAEPHTEEVDLGGHARALRVHRWRLDPAVAEVSAPEASLVRGRGQHTPAGSYLVDSRVDAVLLRFQDGGRRLELSIDRGYVSLFDLASAPTLPAFEPRVATGGEPLTGWLEEHVETLRRSTRPLERVAAVGALVRFWTPSEPDDPSHGPPAVVRGARAWARAVDDPSWNILEREAASRAHSLEASLREICERAAGDQADEIVRNAEERDLLESVSVVCRLAGRGQRLREISESADQTARSLLTGLTEPSVTVAHPRLRSVTWSEPEAWWGTIVR